MLFTSSKKTVEFEKMWFTRDMSKTKEDLLSYIENNSLDENLTNELVSDMLDPKYFETKKRNIRWNNYNKWIVVKLSNVQLRVNDINSGASDYQTVEGEMCIVKINYIRYYCGLNVWIYTNYIDDTKTVHNYSIPFHYSEKRKNIMFPLYNETTNIYMIMEVKQWFPILNSIETYDIAPYVEYLTEGYYSDIPKNPKLGQTFFLKEGATDRGVMIYKTYKGWVDYKGEVIKPSYRFE